MEPENGLNRKLGVCSGRMQTARAHFQLRYPNWSIGYNAFNLKMENPLKTQSIDTCVRLENYVCCSSL